MTVPIVHSPIELQSLPEEYREILVHQILAHTEGELSGADNYHLMAPHAPNAYERKVIYEAAAEEMKHYMIGAKLLADIGVDASFMLTQSLQERAHYPADFLKDTTSWPERGLTSLLAEWAALEHIQEMTESSYRPLAETCPVVMKEEQGHIAHGFRITKRLCEDAEGRRQVQERLNLKWGQVLDLFGRSNSSRSKLFLKWGLRTRSNEEARREFIAKARPKLESIGLEAPPDHLNRQFL
jgi:ring-1,2-phenylacetyl-CoA epoxidase subunit PaaA